MSREQLTHELIKSRPIEVVTRWLESETIAVFPEKEKYSTFRNSVFELFPEAESVFVAGSGNWGYSLNPRKGFQSFHEKSDIDTVIISKELFNRTWNELRRYQHRYYYTLNFREKSQIRRSGENIYSGFASPEWIPIKGNKLRYAFKIALQKLSTELVGYRDVNAVFFKNYDEAIDYYLRGVMKAKEGLYNGI